MSSQANQFGEARLGDGEPGLRGKAARLGVWQTRGTAVGEPGGGGGSCDGMGACVKQPSDGSNEKGRTGVAAELQPAIVARDLKYTYADGTLAVAGITFEVAKGERLAVLGPNGAGKTTLLLLLAGLVFGEGELRVDGEEVNPRTARRWRGKVGLVFQDPDDQLFMPTVLDDVMFGPRNQGLEYQAAREQALDALRKMEAEDLADRPPHHLSAGQKRRVAIAGVLAMQPRILALDEPAAGLDPRGRGRLVACVRDLDVTLVVATHDLALARRLCDTGLLLQAGQQVALGPLNELLAREDLLRKVGLTEQ